MIIRLLVLGFLILKCGQVVNGDVETNQNILREQFQAKLQGVLPTGFTTPDVQNAFELLVEFLLRQFQFHGLGSLLNPQQNITTLINSINQLAGGEVLYLKENHIRIDQIELSDLIKLNGGRILSHHLKNKIILHITQKILNDTVDDYLKKFENLIKTSKFSADVVEIQTNSAVLSSAKNISRGIILELVLQFFRPIQSQLNNTLFNLEEELLKYYKTDLPKDYVPSVITFAVNEAIRRAVEIIELIRKTINESSTTNQLKPRAIADPKANIVVSLIKIILSPIRFILAILLSPIRKLLLNIVDETFIRLRPLVGKIVLMPLETLLRTLISLIPCLKC